MKNSPATGIDVPTCLCQQVMHRKPEKPVLKFSSSRNEYLLWCPTCGFRTHSDWNKQSVITEWYLANRSGDQHIETLWVKRYTEIHSIGTTVPQERS